MLVAAPLHTARFFSPSGVALPDLGGAFLAEAALHDPALHGDAVEGSVDFGHIVTSTGAPRWERRRQQAMWGRVKKHWVDWVGNPNHSETFEGERDRHPTGSTVIMTENEQT